MADTVAVIGEFVGTTLFLFFAFAGTQLANFGKQQEYNDGFSLANLLYISAAFGFGLMVNAWIFFRISGGLFNPAVSYNSAKAYLTDTRRSPSLWHYCEP
jgi:aquaporin related protein